MVDRTIYSLEFRRMVAKAYFTSSKSLSEIGKEFNVKMTTVHTMGSPLWAGIWSLPYYSAGFSYLSSCLQYSQHEKRTSDRRRDGASYRGVRAATQTRTDAQYRSWSDDWSCRRRVKNLDKKKIWSQTVQIVKERHPEYGIDALCGLFGNTRQAYYEKLKYISKKVLTSEIILSLVKDTRIDFPRMGANKMLFHLRPKLYSMGLDIGRDAFVPLLADALSNAYWLSIVYVLKDRNLKNLLVFSQKIEDLTIFFICALRIEGKEVKIALSSPESPRLQR